jgi:hypothetical protein
MSSQRRATICRTDTAPTRVSPTRWLRKMCNQRQGALELVGPHIPYNAEEYPGPSYAGEAIMEGDKIVSPKLDVEPALPRTPLDSRLYVDLKPLIAVVRSRLRAL